MEKSTPSKSDSQTGSDEYDDQMEMSKSSKEEKPEQARPKTADVRSSLPINRTIWNSKF